MKNEAAERLRDNWAFNPVRDELLDAALDEERSRVIEQIRERFNHARIDRDADVFAILDDLSTPERPGADYEINGGDMLIDREDLSTPEQDR